MVRKVDKLFCVSERYYILRILFFRNWEKISSNEKCYYYTWIFKTVIQFLKLKNKFYSCKFYCYESVKQYIDFLFMRLWHVQRQILFKFVIVL